MELKELVTIYRRWMWLLIAGLIAGLACGFIVSKIQTPVYEASTKVLVARNRQQGSSDMLSLSDQQLVTTYQQLLKTKPVLDEAASRLGTLINPESIRAEVIPNTQIIQISVQGNDGRQAAAMANSLVQVVIEQNDALQAARYGSYEDGLNSQIAKVQEQTVSLQKQITQLDQANIEEQLAQVGQQITALQAEIVSLETDIARSPEAWSSTARASLAEKQAQISQLRSLLSLYQQIQTNLTYIGKPVQASGTQVDPQIASLQSTLNLYQQLYLNLLNNLEAVRLSRFQSTPTVTQIEPALPPKAPVRPLPLLYTVLAGLVGLIIVAGAILLIDYFDDSFKSARQIQDLLHAPVIGQISDSAARGRWYQTTTRANNSKLVLENAIGALRINLSRLLAARTQKVILVTSAGRGEGKTTVAVNLARSFVQSGKRVVLVDADLQHPQIHARFGLENHMGLVDLLTAGMDWQEVSCNVDGIAIITGGASSSAQEGLLESDKMSDLLERLQRKADFVIVDAPPLFLVNTQVLASKVGNILLVVQQGKTRTSMARSLTDQLDLMNVSLLGIVVNRVPLEDTYYYDAYYPERRSAEPKEEVKAAETA